MLMKSARINLLYHPQGAAHLGGSVADYSPVYKRGILSSYLYAHTHVMTDLLVILLVLYVDTLNSHTFRAENTFEFNLGGHVEHTQNQCQCVPSHTKCVFCVRRYAYIYKLDFRCGSPACICMYL